MYKVVAVQEEAGVGSDSEGSGELAEIFSGLDLEGVTVIPRLFFLGLAAIQGGRIDVVVDYAEQLLGIESNDTHRLAFVLGTILQRRGHADMADRILGRFEVPDVDYGFDMPSLSKTEVEGA